MDITYNKVDQTSLPISQDRVSASEYNQIAASLMQIITSAGLTPDSQDNAQLLNALGPRIVETYSNGTSWYRVWSDGWVEQGGYSTSSSVTFLQPMADTNYTICTTSYRNGQSTSGDFRYITSYSTTGFSKDLDTNETFWWRVEGQKGS